MGTWVKYELTVNKILAIIIAIVVFGWMLYEEEQEFEEPIITISYKCELALKRPNNIPEHVKKQCIQILKDKNEIEQY